jgi:hypothetical protein
MATQVKPHGIKTLTTYANAIKHWPLGYAKCHLNIGH